MNTETHEIKRGPGRPRKDKPETEPPLPDDGDSPEPPPSVAPETKFVITEAGKKYVSELTHPTQSLGDLYAAIDSAPKEWLPSLLAKIVKTSLKSGAWSDVENLILSVRGFSK